VPWTMSAGAVIFDSGGEPVGGYLPCCPVVVGGGGEVSGPVVGSLDEPAGGRLVEGQGIAVQHPQGFEADGDLLRAGRLRHYRPLGQVAEEPRRRRRQVAGIRVLPGQRARPLTRCRT
jgi:hypothetical protein